ncbi:MAG: DUF1702 family protein [Acidobacteria bacterium]|nr:DUF1702 family protein [Acidobacteriota bacterium]
MSPVTGGVLAHGLPLGTRVKNLVLRLSPADASFERHGFPAQTSPCRTHLESVIRTFVTGYNLALEVNDAGNLTRRLETSCPAPFLGFAYEGVGLRYALSDLLRPWSISQLAWFTKSVAPRYDFIAMVGAGFAVARVPLARHRLRSFQDRLDPMTAWCVADGYGFHQGFFHWRRFRSGRRAAPRSLAPQNRALFDAGVGRSFWWVWGAEPDAIAAAIRRFDADRHPEMWTGIGTAIAYAGGGPADAASRLFELSGRCQADLLVGIALAAHMRHKGGSAAQWTHAVCADLLHASVEDVSRLVETELSGYLESWDGVERSLRDGCYLGLRGRLARHFANDAVRAL